MDLSDADIQEFIELWQQEFGERLSTDETRHHASRLLELLLCLAEPLPSEREQSAADAMPNEVV